MRKSKDRIFLDIAKSISEMSHCVSHKVGAIIVKDNRILSSGYNGTPAGYTNCDIIFDESNFNREEHHKFSTDFEIHAEMNAIIFAARNGISIEGAKMYCTLQPCLSCTKMLCNAGITEIIYEKEYDKITQYEKEYQKDMLACCNILLRKGA